MLNRCTEDFLDAVYWSSVDAVTPCHGVAIGKMDTARRSAKIMTNEGSNLHGQVEFADELASKFRVFPGTQSR